MEVIQLIFHYNASKYISLFIRRLFVCAARKRRPHFLGVHTLSVGKVPTLRNLIISSQLWKRNWKEKPAQWGCVYTVRYQAVTIVYAISRDNIFFTFRT